MKPFILNLYFVYPVYSVLSLPVAYFVYIFMCMWHTFLLAALFQLCIYASISLKYFIQSNLALLMIGGAAEAKLDFLTI